MNEVEKLLASQIGALVIESAKLQITLQSVTKDRDAAKAELLSLKSLQSGEDRLQASRAHQE